MATITSEAHSVVHDFNIQYIGSRFICCNVVGVHSAGRIRLRLL